jgi:hypothetical protein
MRLFRGMRPDDSGRLPKVGAGKTTLDVSESEIAIEDGVAMPGTGGMSVVANDPTALPAHRQPPPNGSAKGSYIFAILQASLPGTLVARQDMVADYPQHRSIEPSAPCTFEQFRNAIFSTQGDWSIFDG